MVTSILVVIVGCFCVTITTMFVLLGVLIYKQLSTHGELRIVKHLKHENIYPPQTPMDKRAQEEREKFLADQAKFANDAVQKVQSLFLDTEESSDGK